MKETSDIDWKEDGTPYSKRFDDVYYSIGKGPAEVEYVFLSPNQIEQGLKEKNSFQIAELGFGTGLNFLMTWKEAIRAGASCRLHYYSVEKYPMSLADYLKAYGNWSELEHLSSQFFKKLSFVEGWNHFVFQEIELNLFIGDVAEYLDELLKQKVSIHVWYLDGFAPSKNPEMWKVEHLKKIYKLSEAGATLSTYTSVGQVRRDLISAGFDVSKQPGFANKREMLVAQKNKVD